MRPFTVKGKTGRIFLALICVLMARETSESWTSSGQHCCQGTGLRLNTAVWSEGEVEVERAAETSLETNWLEDVEMAIAKVRG